jgi:hypothetical protein
MVVSKRGLWFGALLGSIAASSALATGNRTVTNGFDESQCKNGACTILRVEIELDTQQNRPIYNRQYQSIITGNTTFYYDNLVYTAEDRCTKEVIVPVEVFRAIASVFRTIGGNGNPPPVLNPTQQTLILFYTTLLQQTQGFTCSPNDLDIPEDNGGKPGHGGGVIVGS